MIKLSIIIISVIFIVIGKIVHAIFFSEAAIKRKLNRKTSDKITDIKDDKIIQLEGEIITSNTLTTPITNSNCVWFKLEVFSFEKGWELVADERDMVNFTVKDETGTVEVIAKNLEVATNNSSFEKEYISEDQLSSVLSFLSIKDAITPSLLASNACLNFRETWLPANSRITIKGKGNIKEGSKTIKSDLIKPLYISVLKKD